MNKTPHLSTTYVSRDKHNELCRKYVKRNTVLVSTSVGLAMVIVVLIILLVICTSNNSNMRDDVRSLSDNCNSAITAIVLDTDDSRQSLIQVQSEIEAIKNKYQVE